MKKYADVSKVVYDPKGTDPFTFRWYDPDEVIAGKKMREHLKFALSYWHTIDAEGVDMFGSGTMDKSMGQTDPMAKFRAKADFAFELMEKLDIDYYCFHDVDIAPEGATLAESIANFRVMVDYLYELQKKTGKKCDDYRNGDHTTTLMRTANGKVVEIQHNVMNPQPYNRLYQLTGTKGFANKYPVEGFAIDAAQLKATGNTPKVDDLSSHGFMPAAEKKALEEKYEHPIIKKYGAMAQKVGGHGGMDFFMDARMVYCLQNGLPLDMDVYDLAEWCSLAELGSLSMDNNSAAVAFPDFTRGHWNDVKGYKHAYAPAAEEKAAEEAADAFTAAQKEAVVQNDLWKLYDEMKAKGDAKSKKKYEKAAAKVQKLMDKSIAE